jgi:hypothetical protein
VLRGAHGIERLATPWSMPRRRRGVCVTKISSPTIWILAPSFCVITFQPAQSSSASPSSIEISGYFSTHCAYVSTSSVADCILPSKSYALVLGSNSSLAAQSSARKICLPAS